MDKSKIFAAVRSDEGLDAALKTGVETIFMQATNIEILPSQITRTHKAGKKLFIHIDIADGVGKDEYGIRFLQNLGADGIISTRTNIIKQAKKMGMATCQKFFIVDTHSLSTTIDSIKVGKPDMIEVMPGLVSKVIKKIKEESDTFIISGGLLATKEEIQKAIDDGAMGISTSIRSLW